jgi:hypothetical protein
VLANPARVTHSQEQFVTIPVDAASQRYVPVHTLTQTQLSKPAGIIMLVDTTPLEVEDVAHVERMQIGQEEEAEPPEPFEWSPERS